MRKLIWYHFTDKYAGWELPFKIRILQFILFPVKSFKRWIYNTSHIKYDPVKDTVEIFGTSYSYKFLEELNNLNGVYLMEKVDDTLNCKQITSKEKFKEYYPEYFV